MVTAIGIILLLSIVFIAYYCIKGKNMFVGFLILGSFWTLLVIATKFLYTDPEFVAANPTIYESTVPAILKTVFQDGNESQATILANIFFGAWFGKVMMECGITKTLIRKTVELGGDKPLVTMALLNIVTMIIFTSLNGAGPVIAIGIIVLPILLSLGISKTVAVFSFMNAVGMGFMLNPIVINGYGSMFAGADGPMTHSQFLTWAIPSAVLSMIVTFIISALTLKKNKVAHAMAADASDLSDANAPLISLLCPILPFLGILLLKLPVIFCYVAVALFAMLVCGKLKDSFDNVCRFVSKCFTDGVMEIAPMCGFLLGMGVFIKAAGFCAPFFKAVLGGVLPKSTIVVCIIMAVFAPLGMLRGPFSLVGAGAAAATLFLSVGYYDPFVLCVLFIATTCFMNISSCITQSWVVWGLGYCDVDGKDFLKLSLPGGWISCALSCVVAVVLYLASVI